MLFEIGNGSNELEDSVKKSSVYVHISVSGENGDGKVVAAERVSGIPTHEYNVEIIVVKILFNVV